MKLHTLKPAKGSVKTNKRLGRGEGSGSGGTASRGHKGAQSRSGYSQKLGFEGGQMPLQRRIPKYGFNNPNRVEYKAINLDVIQQLVEKTNATKVDLSLLISNGLASKSDKVKVLGRGTLNAAVEVEVHAFSTSAIASIEKSGGKAITTVNR
jgi:large subunit ribosomal protein L15